MTVTTELTFPTSISRHQLVVAPNLIFQDEHNGTAHPTQRLDLLDTTKTNTNLIALLRDLILVKKVIFEVTAVRSDHHDDSALGAHCHACGDCVDGWFLASNKPGDYLDQNDPRFLANLRVAGIDPYLYQTGLGGAAWTHAAAIAAGRSVFQDNGADHIHFGAIL